MATRENEGISGELLDELLGGRDAEMDAHLESERGAGSGNRRNGHNRKRVLTDGGSMDLEVPRDRDGRFDPRPVEKYCRRLPGFDERVVSMRARDDDAGSTQPDPWSSTGCRCRRSWSRRWRTRCTRRSDGEDYKSNQGQNEALHQGLGEPRTSFKLVSLCLIVVDRAKRPPILSFANRPHSKF